MHSAYVLLSGGVDSTTALYKAFDKHKTNMMALSVNYGQRHFKETEHAQRSCDKLDIQYKIIDASALMPKTMLTDVHSQIPDVSYADLPIGISPTYVPFRNGLMLSIATAFIQGQIQHAQAISDKAIGDEFFSGHHKDDPFADYWGETPGRIREGKEIELYYGAHAEDSANWAYPDCAPEFNGAMANAIYQGSYRNIRLQTPLQWMEKHEVVTLGSRLGVDWTDTWSCYKGEEVHCGTCPTCLARKDAFMLAGIADPTEYAA